MGNDTLVALFANSDDAQESIVRLFNIGLPAQNIGFLEPSDMQGHRSPSKRAAKRATASTVLSAVALATVGGALGASLIGLANLAGAMMGALVGVGFGGYAGAILGGLFSAEGPTDDETYVMREIQAGRTLVVATLPDWSTEDRAAAVLHACNALVVDSIGNARLQVQLRRPTGRSMLAALESADSSAESRVA